MKRFQFFFFGVSLVLFLILFSQCHTIQQPDEYYCNIKAGEPTQTSVVLLARLQKSDTLRNNDLEGINGYIKFVITRDVDSKSYMESTFFEAGKSNDFIAKYEFTGLRPGQKYFYKICYGRDTANNTSSPWNTFKTLNLPGSDKNISFIVADGFEYNRFRDGNSDYNVPKASLNSLKSGFPAFHEIAAARPDFIIGNGEIKSDYNPRDSASNPETTLINQWHTISSMSYFNLMFSQIPSFWILNGNDHLSDVSAEHLPISGSNSLPHNYFRTYRLNRDIQVWLLGNNDYYGENAEKNSLPWLKKTLKESDAPFRLLIGPSALNPGADKSEGQISMEEFQTKKDSLFIWLKNNGFRNNGLYFISCTPPRQYHSVDFTGFEEFSCGTLLSAGFRKEPNPIDSFSAIQTEKLKYPYIQNETYGGFLLINSGRDEVNSPVLLFRFFDDEKKLIYAVKKF